MSLVFHVESIREGNMNKKNSKKSSVGARPKGRVRRKPAEVDIAKTAALTVDAELLDLCVSCGAKLIFESRTRLCTKCNTPETKSYLVTLGKALGDIDQHEPIVIECPGASICDSETGMVNEGAEFIDKPDGSYEVKIVSRPVYPPGHTRKKLISPEIFGRVRRCQACQDYTVRQMRREGPDFCAPSSKFPNRTKLKTVTDVSHSQI